MAVAALVIAASAHSCAVGDNCPDQMTLLASLDIHQLSMIKVKA